MPIEDRHWRRDSLLLFLATPWLLFPTQVPVLTLLALVGLAGLWLDGLRRRSPFPLTPLNPALLLWSLMLVVGALVTADPDLTLPKLTGLLLGLAVVGLLARLPADDSRRRWLLAGYLVLGAGLLLLGVLTVDWVTKAPLLAAIIERLPAPLLRLPGTAEAGAHANQLAGALLLLVPVAGAAATGRYLPRLPRIGAALLTGAGLLLLLLSQSRAGWLGAGAGIATLGLLLSWQWATTGTARRRLLLLYTAGGLAGALLMGMLGPQQLRAWLAEPGVTSAVGSLDTIEFRFEVWRWALVAVGDFPFSGVGLGTFRRVALRLYPLSVPPGYDIAHAHNIFLQVALDVGLPGLIAYLALLLGSVQILWRATADGATRPLANGLLTALVAFHVYGLGDALAPGAKPALLFWLILGLALHLRRRA